MNLVLSFPGSHFDDPVWGECAQLGQGQSSLGPLFVEQDGRQEKQDRVCLPWATAWGCHCFIVEDTSVGNDSNPSRLELFEQLTPASL